MTIHGHVTGFHDIEPQAGHVDGGGPKALLRNHGPSRAADPLAVVIAVGAIALAVEQPKPIGLFSILLALAIIAILAVELIGIFQHLRSMRTWLENWVHERFVAVLNNAEQDKTTDNRTKLA